MGKLTPKHCPKCGSTNVHNQELGSEHDYEECYDVYCRDCEWSGYISPDLPLNPTKGKKERKHGARGRVKTLEELKTLLSQLKLTLQEKYGVQTLGIFGSYCRGEQTKKSDLDVMVEYFPEAHPGFFKLIELEDFLTETLGVKVDLGTKDSLKPHIAERVLQEVIYV